MEDTPDDRIHEMFGHALWPDHPIGLPILGSRESVGGFDNAKSLAFRNRHYLTGNCVVAAAGNLDHDEVVRMVEKYLLLPEGPRSTRPPALAAGASRLAVLTKETEQTHICYGMASLNAHHEDRFALSVIDTVLGGGMSSRLFQEIREKKGLAYAVYSFQALYQDTGQFAVYAGTRPSNTEQVIELISAEVERMRLQGMTAEELTLAKDSIKGHMVLGLESTRNRMTRLGKNRVTDGELLSVDEIVARIDSLTLDDVGRVAAEVLAGQKILAMIGPHESKDVQHLLS